MKEGLVLIGAPSGLGKSSFTSDLEAEEFWRHFITATTRQRRPGEVHGKDYYLITNEQYEADKAAGLFCQETTYLETGDRYATYRRSVDEALRQGGLWYGIYDYTGPSMQPLFPGKMMSIYLLVDKAVCAERMRLRGDSPDKIAKRLAIYENEVALGERNFDITLGVNGLGREEVSALIKSLVKTIVPPKHPKPISWAAAVTYTGGQNS